MRRIAGVAVLAVLTLSDGADAQSLLKKWSSEPIFDTPESVIYDAENHLLLVSNISGRSDEKNGNGFISRLSMKGELVKLRWVTGLNAPKGMGIFGRKLFVADIDELVVIDMEKSRIVDRIPAEGSKFLNDIAIDEDGNVFISDTMQNAVYRFDGEKVELWMQGSDIEMPNGLYYDESRLLIGVFSDGTLKAADLETKEISDVISSGSPIDGVAMDGRGNFILSDWKGRTVLVDRDGLITVLLDTTQEKINSADIFFIDKWKMLLIPTFNDNRVVACTLKY